MNRALLRSAFSLILINGLVACHNDTTNAVSAKRPLNLDEISDSGLDDNPEPLPKLFAQIPPVRSEYGKGKNDKKDPDKSKSNEVNSQDSAESLQNVLDVTDKCPRKSNTKRMMTIDEPLRVSHYDWEHLGIVDIAIDEQNRDVCMDAALSDGAEILHLDTSYMRLYYPTRFESFLDDASSRINVAAVEGRWSEALGRLIPGIAGRELNVQETTRRFFDAVEHDEPHFVLAVEDKPALSTDISSVKDFKPGVLIGEYRTHFSKAKNRTHNVKLAAAALDGIFLMPGAEFSYNAWVGERSEERGFKEAPVIENGELVEGLGGGACQVSSTVHAAALMSGLDVLERYNHTLPSSYISKGLDAVVSYPILDLRVKNSRQRPVVLRVTTDVENTLIARFYSDEPRHEKIQYKSEIVGELPFKEVVTLDPELEEGTVKIKRYGKPGYKVQRNLVITEDGKERKVHLGMDTYQSQTQLVSIGPNTDYQTEIIE